MTRVVTGSIRACQRPALSAVSVSAWLASSNRLRSRGSRAKARITRMPESCSRITRLMPSMSALHGAEDRHQLATRASSWPAPAPAR